MADHGRHSLEFRELGRAPAALAGDQLVPASEERPDQNRLNDPASTDGVGQRQQCLLIELVARLIRVRPDQIDGDLAELLVILLVSNGQDR